MLVYVLNKHGKPLMPYEKGDTLYEYSSWDGGIGFDYIRNIKYCPLCGKELKENH